MKVNVFLTAVSKFLPNAPVSNDDMERYLGLINDGYFGSICATDFGVVCASDFGSNCATVQLKSD